MMVLHSKKKENCTARTVCQAKDLSFHSCPALNLRPCFIRLTSESAVGVCPDKQFVKKITPLLFDENDYRNLGLFLEKCLLWDGVCDTKSSEQGCSIASAIIEEASLGPGRKLNSTHKVCAKYARRPLAAIIFWGSSMMDENLVSQQSFLPFVSDTPHPEKSLKYHLCAKCLSGFLQNFFKKCLTFVVLVLLLLILFLTGFTTISGLIPGHFSQPIFYAREIRREWVKKDFVR